MHKCILPWISIETTPLGGVRPCCLYTEELPDINLKTTTLEDAFQSKGMRDLRRSFRRGEKPVGCERCWLEEDNGKKSKRQYMLEKFKDIDVTYENNTGKSLEFIDLKLGNICNLKCRICGTWSSSKWAKEEMDYSDDPKNHIARQWLKDGRWPRESAEFWENLDSLLGQIKYFEFTGGEPWMIKEHFELLQRAVDKGVANNIDIHYNTNGTQYPKEHTVWKKFKHVQIAFSVDNTGERFEYERYGAKWRTVNTNIKRVHRLREEGYPISTQLCTTWNVQNIFYLDEILVWAKQQNFDSIHFNLMHDPWEMAISNMPQSAKSELMLYLQKCRVVHTDYADDINALQQIVMRSKQEDATDLHNKLRRTDLYRNQNFATSHSKMAKAIEYTL